MYSVPRRTRGETNHNLTKVIAIFVFIFSPFSSPHLYLTLSKMWNYVSSSTIWFSLSVSVAVASDDQKKNFSIHTDIETKNMQYHFYNHFWDFFVLINYGIRCERKNWNHVRPPKIFDYRARYFVLSDLPSTSPPMQQFHRLRVIGTFNGLYTGM